MADFSARVKLCTATAHTRPGHGSRSPQQGTEGNRPAASSLAALGWMDAVEGAACHDSIFSTASLI